MRSACLRLWHNVEVPMISNVVLAGKPCANFVKEEIRVLSEEVLDSCQESSYDEMMIQVRQMSGEGGFLTVPSSSKILHHKR